MLTWVSGRAYVLTVRGHVVPSLSLGGDWSDEAGLRYSRQPPVRNSNQSIDDMIGAGADPYTVREWCGFTYFGSRMDFPSGVRSWYFVVVPCWPPAWRRRYR